MGYLKKSWEKSNKTAEVPANVLNHIAARGSFVVIGSNTLYKDFGEQKNTEKNADTQNLSLAEQINLKIKDVNLKSWMENIANNLQMIDEHKDISHIPKMSDKTAIIVGAGPSFKINGHMEILKKITNKTIISTDRMLIPLLESGIVPDFVLSVDGHRKYIMPFYESELINDDLSTIGVMSTTVAPNVVQRFKGKKYFFTPMMDDVDQSASLSEALSYLTKTSVLSTGGNTGVTCINFAFYLGFKNIILTGLDLGYTMDTPIEKSTYYSIFKEADPTMTPDRYKEIFTIEGYNPDYDVKYYTDVTWKSHIDNLVRQSKYMSKKGVNLINATEGGSIHGGTIKCTSLEEAINYE